MVSFLEKLREKSFKRELGRAEKSKQKIKQKAKELAKIEEMKKRLERARGVKGLSEAERKALKNKLDKLEARKKATKKAVKIASKVALKAGKATLKFIFTAPKPRKTRKKSGKKKKR